MNTVISQLYGFEIIKNWYYKFPFEKVSVMGEPMQCLLFEPRIAKLKGRVSLKGSLILELGCFEGVHSSMLQAWGAKRVISIEGKKENFLKSLIVKNAFKLDKCEFLFGDVEVILDSLSVHFDLCLALGILYHVSNPVSLLYRISKLTDTLFVWTHYANDYHPVGQTELGIIQHNGRNYHGKYMLEDTENFLGSLKEKVFWLYENDLFTLVRDAGFNDIELIQKEDHEHGPAMTFLAQKYKKDKID